MSYKIYFYLYIDYYKIKYRCLESNNYLDDESFIKMENNNYKNRGNLKFFIIFFHK